MADACALSEIPTEPQEIEVEHLEVMAPPSGIVSSSKLSIYLPPTVESSSETSRVLTVSTTESSEFVMGDLLMSKESLQSPGPLVTMESSPSPSIHPSQWRSETDISYDLSQLLPTPLMQLREFQEGHDTSFESSPLCPSVFPTSMGSLMAMTETITTSIASTPLLSPSAPLPPLPAPVTQAVSSLSSGRDSEFLGLVLSGIFFFLHLQGLIF